MNKSHFLSIIVLTVLLCGTVFQPLSAAGKDKKREFRGAWIQCVNGQFQGLGTDRMKATLSKQLGELQRDGVNAIIFQVRAECDALYQSSLEPWSRFLTGTQGTPPTPYWDPLAWMIDQCHRRGMELHAWVNPYRAKTKGTTALAASHIAMRRPDLVFTYDGQYILNPGIAENRNYICKVIADIVKRYDIDGLHIDDYFYPYPVAGVPIPDQREYQLDNKDGLSLGDWRRRNVDRFVKQLSDTIHAAKPWVKFGVSPFGIFRNASTAPGTGSKTSGLQNYDDLYANILLWINKGWIDYCVPQLYWEIGHKAADYKELIQWWNRNAGARPLYIGEDVLRTVNAADPDNPSQHQLPAKHRLHQQSENVQGTVLWYAAAVVDNPGNYAHILRNNYWHHPALQPAMPFIDDKAPRRPGSMKMLWIDGYYYLFWKEPKGKGWQDAPHKYVVYRSEGTTAPNLDDPSNIVAITSLPLLKLDYDDGKKKYTYVVTTLDRMSNESKGRKKKLKL